jgi:hypothetical protein
MYQGLGEMELEGLGELEYESEDELEAELEDELEGEAEMEGELEFELEMEDEFESEGPNPVNKIYPDAMMEHLGRAAMNAEGEDEAAEHFLPLIPLVASKLLPLAARALPKLAGRVLPRVAKAITRVTPSLTRSISHLTRTLHRNPNTRRLVRAIPSVARRAVTTIAKRTGAGHSVTPRQAAHILAREHRRVMHNPQILRSVLHRSKLMDHRYHRLNGHRHGTNGHYRSSGVPVGASRGFPGVGWTGGVSAGTRAGACPTCGTRRGVVRSCCCC